MDSTSYGVGSIVRIRLENFVTYSHVDFRPGPHLNMVLGPNGTGKSTIVCAIALGLGGKPEILGRAKEVRDFVRKSASEAAIEIELKGEKENILVERRLHAANNRSTWLLDGKPSSEMQPPQLLQETERAIGSPKLLKQHMELIKLRNDLKTMEISAAGDNGHLSSLQRKLAPLEEQVNRLQERERCLQEIRIIELAIPWQKYEIALSTYREIKDKRTTLKQQRDDYESELVPLRDAAAEVQQSLDGNVKDFSVAKRRYDDHGNKIKQANRAIEAAEERQRAESSTLKAAKQRLTKATQSLKSLKISLKNKKDELQTFQTDLENRGFIDTNGRFDVSRSREYSDLMRSIEQVSAELASCANDYASSQNKLRESVADRVQVERRISQINSDLSRLHETSAQKVEALRRASSDTFSVLEWFRHNKEANEVSFESQVFEPICLHVNITQPEYAASLEAAIGRSNLMNWVVQSKNDYRRLTHQIFDVMRKRCNVVLLNESQDFSPPVPRDEARCAEEFLLKALGFDGYLIDFVQAPPEIVRALCQLAGLHMIPVALRPIERMAAIEADSRIRSYYINGYSYSVRRAYGASATRMIAINDPNILKLSFDSDEEHRLNQEFSSLQPKLQNVLNRIQTLQAEEQAIHNKDTALRAEKTELLAKKKDFTSLNVQFDRKKADVAHVETRITSEEREITGCEDEIQNLKDSLESFIAERSKLSLTYLRLQNNAVELFEARTMLALKDIELLSRKKFIEEKMTSLRERHSIIETAWANINVQWETAKSEARNLKEAAEHLTTEYTMEERKDMTLIREGRTLADLEDMLGQSRARADILSCSNSRAKQEYDTLVAEIQSCQQKIEKRDRSIERVRQSMHDVKEEWFPELRRLIEITSDAFSKSFERIGCAGEVKIHEDDDYEKWGINILVKFRENEKLQALTAHRQSGGERSVSTILFLMALQQVSRAPFRVVDEINQGMDPRNERMVHTQIVDTACRDGSSQYFLITPKLLPDLTYHERMKVLVIYNGEHQPKEFDFRGFIDRKKGAGKQKRQRV
ncbi:Structural maintenance of chromosomes protein 5 [Dinochytrium kinnereticum]|nr:Structural maintenance of chromosomes protein 5 [Dinochytrium kinnereticum]